MYYRVGEVQKFSTLLQAALAENAFDDRIQRRHLYENEKQRIRALNVLAGHQLHLFETEGDGKHRPRVVNFIDEANTISRFDLHNLLTMCFYDISVGSIKQAQEYIESFD